MQVHLFNLTLRNGLARSTLGDWFTGDAGGAVACYDSSVVMKLCILLNNRAEEVRATHPYSL